MIYCGGCGAQNDEERERCINCDALLALPLDIPEPVPTYPAPRASRGYRLVPMVLGALAVLLAAVWLVASGDRAPATPVGAGATDVAASRPVPTDLPITQPPTTPSISPSAQAPGTTTPVAVATATPQIAGTALVGPMPSPSPTPYDPGIAPVGRIVFSSNRDVPGRQTSEDYVNRDIYSMSATGTGLARLTAEAGYDGQPIWSPDGERIAFTSDRTGRWQIWTMEADGSNPRQLTDDPVASQTPDWSPDGKLIAYHGGPTETSDIWAIPATGGEPIQLTNNKVQETAPAWSPDGQQLAFMGKVGDYWQIFVTNADGTGMEQVTGGETDHRYPRWHPDGRRIMFNTRTREPNLQVGQIYIMNADGANRRQITRDGEGRNGRAFPSPDGRYIAFNSDRDGDNFEIYTMRPDGSEVQRLTNTPGDDFEPAWIR